MTSPKFLGTPLAPDGPLYYGGKVAGLQVHVWSGIYGWWANVEIPGSSVIRTPANEGDPTPELALRRLLLMIRRTHAATSRLLEPAVKKKAVKRRG
jgi:hypothetical protein